MRSLIVNRLEVRLAATVGMGLLVFAAVAGLFTYRYAYHQALAQAATQQQQLVRTVQAQAEVAAFAANREIARGVVEGLLANPVILAVRIESTDGFHAELGPPGGYAFGAGQRYPLFSPVGNGENIGILEVVRNDARVEGTAARAALFQTALLLAEVLIAAIIMALVLRIMMIDPIVRLARAIGAIQPGSSQRLTIVRAHAGDEIGLLAKSANALLDAAEAAIEEVRAQRNELEMLATHDHLTGLPTTRLADDRLQVACAKAVRKKTRVGLLFIDLDGFKEVNDSHGHEAGDEVLQEAARRLRHCIRAEDTAARLGGDEFVVIVEGLPEADAAGLVAENIGAALARPFEVRGLQLRLGASIGIAIFPDHSGDVKALRRIADTAMYTVKRSGKGAWAFAAADAARSA